MWLTAEFTKTEPESKEFNEAAINSTRKVEFSKVVTTRSAEYEEAVAEMKERLSCEIQFNNDDASVVTWSIKLDDEEINHLDVVDETIVDISELPLMRAMTESLENGLENFGFVLVQEFDEE